MSDVHAVSPNFSVGKRTKRYPITEQSGKYRKTSLKASSRAWSKT